MTKTDPELTGMREGGYATRLLESLGLRLRPAGPRREIPAEAVWAACGAMDLTGTSDGPPVAAPAQVAAHARAALETFARVACAEAPDIGVAPSTTKLAALDGAALLSERAAIAGLRRAGAVSPGGTCRLVRAADGWIAVNLARDDDRDAVAAWLETDPSGGPWESIHRVVASRPRRALVERARLIGLPVGPVAAAPDHPTNDPPPWHRERAVGLPHPRRSRGPIGRRMRVVDLSALWAGPLCTHLLALAGADVIKVESSRRPDGARNGPAAFFDLMHGDKRSVALDLSTGDGRAALLRLLRSADIVVEGSRPRALAQMGIDAVRLVETTPGLVWISITGYGRGGPEASWVAFGDDAAAAAGACSAAGSLQSPIFCADAVADPLTGIHAALVAMASCRTGRARLVDVSLVGVTRHVLFAGNASSSARDIEIRRSISHEPERGETGWEVRAADWRQPVLRPRARTAARTAAALGADTAAVLAETLPREAS